MSAHDPGRRPGTDRRNLRAERLDLLLRPATDAEGGAAAPPSARDQSSPAPHNSGLADSGLAGRQRANRARRLRGRTAARTVLGLLTVLVLAVPAWWALSPRPSPAQASGTARPGAAPSRTEPAAAATLLVHVSGAVQRPGVIRLPESSRLFQALEQAGGAAPEARLDSLNLAAEVKDGQHIHVPVRGEPPVPQAGSGSEPGSSSAEGAAVGLNSATVEQLMSLPRIGKVLAERIVAWRQQHGRFSRVEDLGAVDGIGPKLLEQLIPRLSLD